MKKSTKIIATVIAVTLVITAMLVAIYAATAGNANITANVSWTAQAGVNLEFWAKATGGDETKEIAKTTITPTTTNTDANIIGDLSCNFTDTTDDGVNNPNAIIFTYYVRNKSLTPLNIKVTKTPAEAEESGTGAENHKPKVSLNSDTEGNNTLTAVSSNAGYDLKAGDIFTYSVTLSLAKGGTGTINADFGLAPNFDAGVTFNFNVGGDNNGTIVTSVDGASPTTVSSSTLSGQTLGEYLATQQTAEYFTGWFFDEGLTKVVSDDYLSQSLNDSSLMSSLYCKTASITGLVFTLSDDGNSYLVAGESTTSPSGEVIIPNMYNGKPVSGLADNAFDGNTNIINVMLSNNITEIAKYAFMDCTSIIDITIPNTITKINIYSFYECENLRKIIFPEGLTKIASIAFAGCSSITNIEIPSTVTSVGLTRLFDGCVELKSITVKTGNMVYDSRDNCNAIIETSTNKLVIGCKTTVIPNSVTSIGYNAFIGSGLISIVIPDSVKELGSMAFTSCEMLSSITIGSGITLIDDNTFASCLSLINIDIPSNIKTINRYAFAGCKSLKEITIPSSVTSIGQNPFNGCSSLEKIVVDKNNTKYDSRNNCNAIIETSSSTLISGCKNTIIPNTIKSIRKLAFMGLTHLISITIPSSVTSIEEESFSDCDNLAEIKVDSSNTKYDSRDNCNAIIETATNKLIAGCKNTIIPNTVTNIANYAFYSCDYLTGIVIPSSVVSIGNLVFGGCKNLVKIYISESVTTIFASGYYFSPFINCSSTLQIYCEASEKPSGWGTYWNYYDSSNQLNVTWGVTRAQFDAL